MTEYPAIEDHGLIGDLQTVALVTDEGNIDWFCSPKFDSPSLFASLLDQKIGGHFKITPVADRFVSRQLYLPGTAILITRFMTPDGVAELTDFMPVAGRKATDKHQLVRLVRMVRGQMSFTVECSPAFDYGRQPHKTEITEHGVAFHGDAFSVNLSLVTPPDLPADQRVRIEQGPDGGVRAEVTATAGRFGGMILETEPNGPPRRLTPGEAYELLDTTRDFWRSWLGQSTYRGRWREMVERSAITLKLMTYAPTGALVAAPTAGLPEQVGGERNWDYRFTWVRDASFSVHALLGLGFTDEASEYLSWLSARVKEADERSAPLQIMYRVDGSSELPEVELNHLSGYRNSRPVRIGNGAATQTQLDIYGEALDSIHLAAESGLVLGDQAWRHVRSVVDWLCDAWDGPDAGLWETRGGPKDFVYGRVMSWVGLDRAIKYARSHSRPADLARWIAARDEIYEQVHARGWSTERQAFVQYYGGQVLDASLLYMPLVGFIEPTDPKWLSTLDAMDTELVSDSLVYRYNPEASPDGLRGSEGTFSICTFWYVEALAKSGRLDEARLTFEKMHTYANHLGLYAEEIGPTGEQLGNFPQAFSHLALITAARNLDRQLG